MLTAVQALQAGHLVLRRLSARRLRSILRPWFRAHPAPPGGPYTPADVLRSLEVTPSGAQHEFAGRVRDPAAWLEYRMSFWLDAAGDPLPPHSARLAAEASEHQARADAARTERAAIAAGKSANYAGHAATAREMLRQARRAASQNST
jgi:hypothetical protein